MGELLGTAILFFCIVLRYLAAWNGVIHDYLMLIVPLHLISAALLNPSVTIGKMISCAHTAQKDIFVFTAALIV